MSEEQDRLMELFNEARAKGSAEERETHLTAACGGGLVELPHHPGVKGSCPLPAINFLNT